MKIENLKLKIIFIGIFLLAAFFRLYGVNWDNNQHLHPDERFLTMVAGAISWPQNLWEYLDAATSPLNPHNRGYGFYVYGTFPLFLTKWVAEIFNKGDYMNLTIVGRQLSAIFDLGTVILVFLIGKEILRNKPINTNKYQLSNKWKNKKMQNIGLLDDWVIGLFAAFFYAASVLPIQLSHFFAVDTYLTFFLALSFYLLIKIISLPKILNTKYLILNTLLGIAFGLAIASKISAIYFLPIIGLGLLTILFKNRNFFRFFVICFLLSVVCYLTVRLAQPYLFATSDIFNISLNPKVMDNWKQLESFNDKSGGFPPAVQWINTKPYLFPLKNMLLWGMGLPMGIISIVSALYYILLFCHSGLSRIYKKVGFWSRFAPQNDNGIILSLSLIWVLFLFIYQGGQFVKALRYFYQIYPFLAIISALFICNCMSFIQKRFSRKIGLPARIATQSVAGGLGYWVIGLLVIVYPLSFLSIYIHPNSRIQASYWIYKNIPAGSTLSSEEWDDGLPMSLNNYIHELYKSVQFPLYWPETKEKWDKITNSLDKTDYIILSSNRLYGSIMTFPQKYPVTIKFYNSLFDGTLGFTKLAEFTSRPNIPIPFLKLCLTPPYVRYGIVAFKSQECLTSGISFVDDYADETFTVYDHPKVIIFKKVKEVDYLGFLYSK